MNFLWYVYIYVLFLFNEWGFKKVCQCITASELQDRNCAHSFIFALTSRYILTFHVMTRCEIQSIGDLFLLI